MPVLEYIESKKKEHLEELKEFLRILKKWRSKEKTASREWE